MLTKRIFWLGLLGLVVTAIVGVAVANHRVNQTTESRVHADLADVPETRVGLVLGCSPTLRSGAPNPFFEHRLRAAARLWQAGKCRAVLLSGDNHVQSYDEPTAMKSRLLELGVPATAMTLDYAGFSTFDSVVRARKVFGVDEVCFITQADHARRAVFIADHFGIRASAFAADEVGFRLGIRTSVRELLAKARTVLDLTLLGRRPHFLGPKIEIADARTATGFPQGGLTE